MVTRGTVAVIGLGRMGAAMAGRLIEQGFEVVGYDVQPQAREALQARAEVVESAAALAGRADWYLISLPSSREVEQILIQDTGLLRSLEPGACVIDCSSSDPRSTRGLAEVANSRGIAFLDAPVSGGPAGAEAGTLAIAVGGTVDALETAWPVLGAMAARIVHVGDSGAGHVAKIANNLLCAAHLMVDGAGVRLAAAAGVDPERLLEAVNAGSGRSAVTEAFMPKWVLNNAFNSGFTMSLMQKDLGLARDLLAEFRDDAMLSGLIDRWDQETERLGGQSDFTNVASVSLRE
nr:NAD(P)-dependent oxidoreductase [Rhodovibrio salinarum]